MIRKNWKKRRVKPVFISSSEFTVIDVLHRYHGNPILLPQAAHWWESKAVFNPGAIYEQGQVHIIYRAIGNSDISVFGYAASRDGFHVDKRLEKPAYIPREPFEGAGVVTPSTDRVQNTCATVENNENEQSPYISGGGGWGGCEDPRVTKIDDRVFMTYVAFDGCNPPRVALSSISIDDFLTNNWQWSRPVLISPPGVVDKNACILPEKINSQFAIFHRIFPDILIDFVDDLDFDGAKRWLKGEYKISPRIDGWDSRKVGVGAPPIKTKDGWLLIYQAIGEYDPGRYKIGAMLLDMKDPTKVLARLKTPILEPTASYENSGWKTGVVYPCGAVVIKNQLFVYYGGADTVTCVATANLDELLGLLTGTQPASAGSGVALPPLTDTSPVKPENLRQTDAYCLKCRRKRIMKNPVRITLKNGRSAIRGVCSECRSKVFMITKTKNNKRQVSRKQ